LLQLARGEMEILTKSTILELIIAMLKKILKYTAYVFGVLVVILIGLGIWYWDTISILAGNKNLTGSVENVPKVQVGVCPPITQGLADWPCWLGNKGDNSVSVTAVPGDWSKGLKKLWEVSYLCQGPTSSVWAAPVIYGNHLIVCGRNTTDDVIFCLDPNTGELIWQGAYPAKNDDSFGSGFRATPWVDKEHVYTYGRSGQVVCWNLLNGEKIWQKNVTDDGGKAPQWGFSSSPYVTGSLVIVDAGGTAGTIAYDKNDGQLKWKCNTGSAGYAAITAMKIEGQDVILDFCGAGLSAVAADTGKELWNVVWKTNYDVNASTPVVDGDSVFITSGYSTGCQLLKAGLKSAEVVWKNTHIASHHSDPIIIQGYIYGYSGLSMQNKGEFKCLDLKTGQEKWSTGKMGWGTAIRVNEYLLCMDIKGNLFLIKPNPDKFELVTSMPNALGQAQGAVWTKPVIANDKLYLRFKQTLVCYEF
jgi:outer membrane protein assembly factor BamB